VAEYLVVVQETRTYRVRVDADNYVDAMRAAKAARAAGQGTRTSRTPIVAVPSVSKIKN
jgi:hypothetical protein